MLSILTRIRGSILETRNTLATHLNVGMTGTSPSLDGSGYMLFRLMNRCVTLIMAHSDSGDRVTGKLRLRDTVALGQITADLRARQ